MSDRRPGGTDDARGADVEDYATARTRPRSPPSRGSWKWRSGGPAQRRIPFSARSFRKVVEGRSGGQLKYDGDRFIVAFSR